MTQTFALVGVHASGKSTLIDKLHEYYKSNGKSVYVVKEVARDCARDGKFPLGTVELQRKIWYAHWHREMEASESNADIVLIDRSVIDNLVYFRDILNQTLSEWGEDSFKFFYPIAKIHMLKYDCVARLPLNLKYLKADDPIRPKSVEYAMRIDKLFDKYVSPYVNCVVDDLWTLQQRNTYKQ